MKENLERTVAFIMAHEGAKITQIKGDRGGLTAAYGLTLGTMQSLKLDLNNDGVVNALDVPLVTEAVVRETFRKYFWNAVGGDTLPAGIDLIAADIAWNSGAGKFFQFKREGFARTVEALCKRRELFYEHLSKEPGQAKFLAGWKNRVRDSKLEAAKCVGG